MVKFKGLCATPVTAFDQNGHVDPSGIRRLVDFVAAKGVKNLFCLGSWGGFPLLNWQERRLATKAYLDAAIANSLPVIINVSSTTPKEAIELAKYAQDNGATAVASLVPFYYSSSGYTQRNVLHYFDALVSSIQISVHFYNNPRTTGYKLSIDLFEKLLDTGIRGMKEGGGDQVAFINMVDLLKRKKVEFDMIPGSVTMLLISLLYGVKAAMIGSAVVFPELAVAAWNAWRDGDIDKATRAHAKLMRVRRIQSSYGMGAAACYGLLRLRGIDIGHARAPWLDPSSEELRHLQQQFRGMGLPI